MNQRPGMALETSRGKRSFGHFPHLRARATTLLDSFLVDRFRRGPRRTDWVTLSYPPLLRPRRASGLGTFRAQLVLVFHPLPRISWVGRSPSIPRSIERSTERSGH